MFGMTGKCLLQRLIPLHQSEPRTNQIHDRLLRKSLRAGGERWIDWFHVQSHTFSDNRSRQ